MRPTRSTVALALLAAAGAALVAQGPPPPPMPPMPVEAPRDVSSGPQVGTARLTGRVLANEATVTPVRRAILLLSGGGLNLARQTTTDEQGRFVLGQLPAGQYTLTAWRSGFVRDLYGNRRPGVGSGTPITLVSGKTLDLTMRMTRSAAITGTVLSTPNVPLAPGIRVQAMQIQTIGTERMLANVPSGVSPNGGTGGMVDDRGVYRIYGLAPGEYVLATSSFAGVMGDLRLTSAAEVQWAAQLVQSPRAANAPPAAKARPVAYAPVFFPGTTDPAAAATITVTAGEERVGADIPLQVVPVAKIEGLVQGADGQPFGSAQVMLVASGGSAFVRTLTAQVRTGADGRFTITGVAPGHYMFAATTRGGGRGGGRSMPAAGALLWTSFDLDIDGRDVSSIVATLQPGAEVKGRVDLRGFEGKPPLQAMQVMLTPVGSEWQTLAGQLVFGIGPDGTFTLSGLPPGQFRASVLRNTAVAAWLPSSLMLNGRDVLDDAFELRSGQTLSDAVLTLTDHPSQIVGSVKDSAGAPRSDLVLVAFATDRRFWMPGSRRVVQVTPAADGSYRVSPLPSGEYYVCGVTDADNALLSDPSFLESLVPASRRVTLAEGQTLRLDLQLGGRRGSFRQP